MKKAKSIALILCMGIYLCFVSLPALAGDVPESIIGDRNTEVIIGTIKNIGKTKTTVEVAHALFETIDDSEIEIDNFTYTYFRDRSKEQPCEGDYCVVAVFLDGAGQYSACYGLSSKADSLDPKTLKLESPEDFVVRMNGYVNDGKYSKKHRDEFLSKQEIPMKKSPAKIDPPIMAKEPLPAQSLAPTAALPSAPVVEGFFFNPALIIAVSVIALVTVIIVVAKHKK